MINTSRLKCVTSYFIAFFSALNAAVSLFRCIHETESAAASCRQATVNEFAQPHRLHLPVYAIAFLENCHFLSGISWSNSKILFILIELYHSCSYVKQSIWILTSVFRLLVIDWIINNKPFLLFIYLNTNRHIFLMKHVKIKPLFFALRKV